MPRSPLGNVVRNLPVAGKMAPGRQNFCKGLAEALLKGLRPLMEPRTGGLTKAGTALGSGFQKLL